MLLAQESGRDGTAKPVRSRFARPEFPGPDPAEPAHLVHDRTPGGTGDVLANGRREPAGAVEPG